MHRAAPLARLFGSALASLAVLATGEVAAEPYIAIQNGLACSACHVNRTGGGLRTRFGSGVGRESIPWTVRPSGDETFDGSLHERVRVGGDLRAAYRAIVPDAPENRYVGEYAISSASLYLAVEALADRVSIVVDERVAPGGAAAREAFALVTTGRAGLYGKFGRFYPPFGWRLVDDDAATRRHTGFTFDSSDVGVEIGAEPGPTALAIAVSNGSGGGAETDNGKQWTARAEYVGRTLRAGISAAWNDGPGALSKRVGGVFGGLVTGPVVWLAEWDSIEDRAPDLSRTKGSAAHLEAVWQVCRGVALRAWGGRFDPDLDVPGDDLTQTGVGGDLTPLPGVQVRGYYRWRHGPPDAPQSRDDRLAVELHLYF